MKYWIVCRIEDGAERFFAGKVNGAPLWTHAKKDAKRYKSGSGAAKRCARLRYGRGERYHIERVDEDAIDLDTSLGSWMVRDGRRLVAEAEDRWLTEQFKVKP